MQFMNKTYLIFTLILLSACSQPKYDGFWHDEEYGDDVSVKIRGNVFTKTGSFEKLKKEWRRLLKAKDTSTMESLKSRIVMPRLVTDKQ